MYIDEVHKMQQKLEGYKKSLQVPVSCSNGHVFIKKPHGGLECKLCHMIPFGIIVEQ